MVTLTKDYIKLPIRPDTKQRKRPRTEITERKCFVIADKTLMVFSLYWTTDEFITKYLKTKKSYIITLANM